MINKTLHVRRKLFALSMALVTGMALFFGCTKEGEMEEVSLFTRFQVDIKTLKTDKVSYRVMIDDAIVGDSTLLARATMKSTDGLRKLKVTELLSNTVLLDTMLTMPRPQASYTIYQIDTTPGAKPLFIDKNGEDTTIPADQFMHAFYANSPLLPEVFDIYVYKIIDYTYVELPHAQLYKNVHNGEFTEFIPLEVGGVYLYEFRSTTGELLKDFRAVVPDNPSGGGVRQRKCSSNSSNHQITRIQVLQSSSGANTYRVLCMFEY